MFYLIVLVALVAQAIILLQDLLFDMQILTGLLQMVGLQSLEYMEIRNTIILVCGRAMGMFAPDEINTFAQVQVRFGGKESHTQLTFTGFKQKFDNENGFGYEAPTGLHFGVGLDNRIASIGKNISLNSNISAGVGPEVGVPRFDDPTVTTPPRASVSNYSIIGVGASMIARIDAKVVLSKTTTVSLFVALIYHHTQTFAQPSSIGTQAPQTIGSLGVVGGAEVLILVEDNL